MNLNRIFERHRWLILLILLLTGLNGQRVYERQSGISGHSKINNLAFYIQRSVNANIIAYVLNSTEIGELDVKEPLKIYWKNYATDSTEEPLNYIQRKYVYGITAELVDPAQKKYCLSIVSYEKKKIFLVRLPSTNNYRAVCEIDHKIAVLNRIFIQVDGGSFWFPKIRYVELSGNDLALNEPVKEIIKP